MKPILLLILVMTASVSFGQKVKYKDGQVFVDKVHQFDFMEIDADDNTSDLKQYALKDLSGKEVLTLTDTAFYYEKLPNELVSRKAFEAYALGAPSLGMKKVMPYNPIMNYPKQRIQDLDKIGFFSDFEMTQKRFDEFLEKQYPESLKKKYEELEAANTNRKKNYALSEEKFGGLLERNPGNISVVTNIKQSNGYVIKDGETVVGEFRITDKDSYKPGVLVLNSKGEQIALGTIFRDAVTERGVPQYKYGLKLYAYGMNELEENYKWFYTNVRTGAPVESVHDKLEVMANFLINEGFM